MKNCLQGYGGGLFVFAFALTVGILFAPSARAEEDPAYGPRFEIGGGIGYSSENQSPRWAPDYYKVGTLTGTLRLIKGLALQGGVEWSDGGKPLSDSISYGNSILKINKGTFGNARWAGIRYELPMSVIGKDIAAIHSLYVGGGYTWSEFGVRSTEWTEKDVTKTAESAQGFKLADLKGPYAVFAARWRIDNPEAKIQDAASWVGAYGVDLGVRYTRFSEQSREYPSIPKVSDQFSSMQVFLVGFLKFRLFE